MGGASSASDGEIRTKF